MIGVVISPWIRSWSSVLVALLHVIMIMRHSCIVHFWFPFFAIPAEAGIQITNLILKS